LCKLLHDESGQVIPQIFVYGNLLGSKPYCRIPYQKINVALMRGCRTFHMVYEK